MGINASEILSCQKCMIEEIKSVCNNMPEKADDKKGGIISDVAGHSRQVGVDSKQ